MNQDRLLNMLGLAMRAGKLVTGEEAVVKEIRSQNAKLVFVAQDAGKNTHKKIQDKSTYYEISFFDGLTQAAISQAIGRPRTAIAVMDGGFAKKMKELIQG
ncbi:MULTISPECIES: YlxQ-related RNA-binding protein [Enterococcus]|uniref:Ribosomal protein eL8/eL30/eS12/Gadd45 domain-containing protein n=1 Tax=Enterococcus diestrammenae TaxID=1155073 RepID=A0ABV0F2E7_9ENTE|nr:YlxQ-related RNA-binding protein [Enterococcus diestrammenae]KAF1299915.1 50S ribosomal protein L7 [Enterococcus diestrammenae]HIX70291.1 YlxQ-related RNA-binding protein [Candidatus Enterococcus stercoravium]